MQLGRPLPDVLIIGAMRAGTSFLRANLAAHPDVVTTRIPEPQFFTRHWHGGIAEYRRYLPLRLPGPLYRAVGRRQPLLIDVTPYYLFHPQAAARAASVLGRRTKFIVILREPGARAWSHYRHSLMRGVEHLGFLDAIAAEKQRLAADTQLNFAGDAGAPGPHQEFSYVARGYYAEQLSAWWRCFPREQFLLLRSMDLFQAARQTLDRTCRFLGLPAQAACGERPCNAAFSAPMPLQARRQLDRVFCEPNGELRELTGIDFD